MSKTFTSRPSVTSTRGRGTRTNQGTRTTGAGRGAASLRSSGYGTGAVPRTTRPRMENQEMENPHTEGQSAGPSTGAEQRMTYQGGYSMIAPNEKKRQQITQVAARETAAYNAHKQKNTPKKLNIVGTVGGGQLSQFEARQKAAQAAPTKTQKLLQQQERKSWLKQKEEEEIQQKKAEQRAKSEQNERRQKEMEASSANRWDEQKRRTNEAFLQRLENKTKKGPNATKQPDRQGQSSSQPQTVVSSTIPLTTSDACASFEDPDEAGLSVEEKKRLAVLTGMYPQYSKSELRDILEQTGFSLDLALDLLQLDS